MKLISVIIPVYKVEEYLERCVDSVLNQTYQNVEIILVDDGSPDNCPEICDYYANKDQRVKVVHKENGGLSDARNEGLKAATGDYILFLDSDDTIVPEACEVFAEAIQTHDYPTIIVGQTLRISETERIIINPYLPFDRGDGEAFLYKYWSKKKNFCAIAQNNLYHREYLLESGFFFEKGLLHEDERWTPVVFLNAPTVVSIEHLFYCYYIRDNSITTKKDKTKNAVDLISTVYYLEGKYRSIKNADLRRILEENNANLYLSAIMMGNFAKRKENIDRGLVWKHVYTLKGRIKAVIFCVSPYLYDFIVRRRLQQ